MRWAWIYVEGFRLLPKVLAQYRADTIATVIGDILYRAVRLAFIGVIFSVTPQLGQWTAWEVMLMWSMAMLADAIGNFLFAFPNKVDGYFHSGQFDYARVRPVPIVLWANLDAAHPRYAMVVITFLATTAVSAANSGIFENPAQTGLLLLALVCTVFVLTGMRLIMFLSCAWFTRSRQFFHGIASFMDHSRYPIDIMDQPLRGVLTAIPIAFTVFYPVAFALRPDQYLMPGVLGLPVGVAMMAGGLVTLRFALRKYQSVGTPEVWGAS